MLVAFVESRPKKGGEVWEDVMLGRQEMPNPPGIGWVIRIPVEGGSFRRYRVREIVQDLPGPGNAERVIEHECSIYVVPIPPSGTLEAATAAPARQPVLFPALARG